LFLLWYALDGWADDAVTMASEQILLPPFFTDDLADDPVRLEPAADDSVILEVAKTSENILLLPLLART
jgi:hypothetical protein